jgi:ABC-2 type transport system ATP-binding protein
VILVENLTKRFAGVTAVDDLSFTVAPGHVTGFLGPNGSGKSTTMRCMIGLDHAQSGSATFNGVPYSKLSQPLQRVGVLLDAGNAHSGRSARNHLLWMAANTGIGKSRVDAVLEQVGLSDVSHRRVGKYSLGMKQRLGIASVLLGDPEVLILDEPVNGLDPEGIRWLRDLLRDLAKEGRTVLVSSHLLSEMALIAEELVVIGQGKLITQCSVGEFTARYAKQWVRVVSPQIQALKSLATEKGATGIDEHGGVNFSGISALQLGELAASAGIVLHELSPQAGSLEDAFLDATAISVQFHSAQSEELDN